MPKDLLIANVGDSGRIDHCRFAVHDPRPSVAAEFEARDPAAEPESRHGRLWHADNGRCQLPPATGVGEVADQVDYPSALRRAASQENGQIARYVSYRNVSRRAQSVIDQPVEVDGHTYDLALRFKRIYHPFTVTLKDFRYVATTRAPTRRRIIHPSSYSKTRSTTSIAKFRSG